jgi:hypothetical protein
MTGFDILSHWTAFNVPENEKGPNGRLLFLSSGKGGITRFAFDPCSPRVKIQKAIPLCGMRFFIFFHL